MTSTDVSEFSIHRLSVPIVFPAGIAPGSGKGDSNLLGLERRGTEVVLRGTAVAGVLRHAFAMGNDADTVMRWFGHALGEDHGHTDRPSPLRVADVVLDLGQGHTTLRNHNSIERHTGAVRDGGLFSLEALPPGTRGLLEITLQSEPSEDRSEAVAVLRELATALTTGLFMGGNVARGIGLCQLDPEKKPTLRTFDLRSIEDHAAWLDESWATRNGRHGSGGTPLELDAAETTLRVELELTVPRGQDVCVGEDAGLDFQIVPQRVKHADGQEYWRLPGSSLRGVFRSWVTRLAARAALRGECKPPADTADRFDHGRKPASGNDIAWGFFDENRRKEIQRELALAEHPGRLEELVPCPVMRLFGSLFSAGRVHISDFRSTDRVSEAKVQGRRHVAVDRITGGASEGLLFSHQALLAGVRFKGTLLVRTPSEQEAQWLADTLRALDLGVLRVGSSKSAGRLALARVPVAVGEHAARFTDITPTEPS